MNQITLTGMVLSAVPIGEYDKRVVLLTRERGKISAFARGARKPGSPLSGNVMPFTFGQFAVYEGRTSYTLMSASVSNYFAELRTDIEGAYYGFYFLEIADYYGREGNDESQLLKLLYQSLRALVSPRIPDRLVRYVYELKAICINGEAPQVFRCVACGSEGAPVEFSALRGGRICADCAGSVADGLRLSDSTWYTLQCVESTPVERLYTFTVSEEVLRELGMVMGRYMDVYVDRQFKSLEILKQMS